MNRRHFLARSLAMSAALAAPSLPRAWAQSSGRTPVRVVIDPDQPLDAIAPEFMGLGYEISSVAVPGLLSPANSLYAQLVRTLGRSGVIRIGGNTSDFARYAPDAPAVSTPFGTVVNDAALRDLAGFLRATGWKLIWGLNLGSGSVTEAVAEAAAVLRYAGSSLLAFEIGNEPDLFHGSGHRPPGYSYDEWLAEFRRYATALQARFPAIPLAGPDAAGHTDWVTRFAADQRGDLALLTHHYYRGGQRNPKSTIAELLGPDPKLQPELDAFRAASEAARVPYRICEVNSFSGGGRPGVSDTLAGALWALDFMYTLAASGCSGVNMETGVNQLGFVSSYSPISDDTHGHYAAAPEYYGMLAFALGGHGNMVGAQVVDAAPAVRAYATRQSSGELVLTLLNKGAEPALVAAAIQGSHAKYATAVRLLGPSLDAKTGITLGGAGVSAAGLWASRLREHIPLQAGRFRIALPAASAAVVTLA